MKMLEGLAFKQFYEANANLKLSIRTAYKMAKIYKLIVDEVDFYNARLKQYLDEYAETDENGNFIFDDKDNILLKEEFVDIANKKITDLNNFEFNCDISLSLDDFDELKLSPSDLMALMPFIEE